MNNEKILIVEDEKIIALDLQRRLERFGYTVVGMASDGPEAVQAARERMPDIILMDIMLAGPMDGIEAARQVRDQLGIPVIFLTAYTDEKTLERAKEVEPFGYILKPFKERELYTTIDIALYKNILDKQLRKQERLFSAILHTINDGIIATDTDFRIMFMNPVAEDIVGWPESEAKGKPVAEILALYDHRAKKNLLVDEPPPIAERPYFFSELAVKNAAGQTLIVDGSITRIHEKENSTDGFVIAIRDITELKRMSETINYQASHDNLTGLSNREEFSYKLNELLKTLRASGARHALLVIDVDRFKAVNDTCGALAGDELLRQIASHIQANISRRDISARIGGDEFAIILMDCDLEDGVNVAKRLQEAVQARKFVWQNGVFPVTLSIGAVPLGSESEDTHAVLAAADDACHLSKEEGGNKINIFRLQDDKFQKRRGDMEWIAKINRAVEENRFILYHQPIVPLDASAGLEAKTEILIRLVNEDGSIASPGHFIPAAERYNLMPLIDRWVIVNAMKSYRLLMDRGADLAGKVMSINLSGPSVLDETLIDLILLQTRSSGLDPSRICFEITETAAIQNLSYATRFMKTLKDQGFTFALDDFGSGFSSFGYLKNLPVDYLKIDGSLVQGIEDSAVSYAMVESINSIGHVMGIKTIAEFVKSPEIRAKVAEIGVDYAQGYDISQPIPLL
ncbi:MAG: EAL domain-containing protein [Spirochaetaceae bacterium]|nr:EAL domain-containing protein [Spirochaetaceae bacterium]